MSHFHNSKTIHLEIVSHQAIMVVCLGLLVSMVGHIFHLPIWVNAFISLALAWRLAQNEGMLPMFPRWLLIPLVIAGGFGVFATFGTITGRDAGLALLSVMTAFKLLESKTHRDALILIFLSYFILVTHFLFSQSIFIAIYMLTVLLFLTASLISLNERNITLDWKTRFKLSGSLLAYSIPLMIVLFILVPRVPGPLWGLTNEQRGGVTGLSDSMSPGKISSLIQDNSVAFRVKFADKIPPQRELYWRGPVLSRFDGKTWFQLKNKKQTPLKATVSGVKYSYTITMEANGKKWLLPLDLPVETITDSTMSFDFELKSTKAINDLKKYTLTSYTQSNFGLDDSFDYLSAQTDFPEQLNPKTIAYAQQLRQQFNDDEQLLNFVLQRFKDEPYFYTLNPPLLNANPVDDFLFNTKKGFCEHYSSSFALLMRAADIPARVVTGYQGGELNKEGQYLIVRQSDAHAWTEVWLDDKGWVRIDPTAAVSPDRVEKSLEDALNNNNEASYQFNAKNSLLGDLLLSWDNIQFNWNNWVLNYNQKKQASFLKQLGLGINNTGDMVIILVAVISLLTLAFALISWYKNMPKKPEYYEQLFITLKTKCAKAGIPFYISESPKEYLRRIQSTDNIVYSHALLLAIELYVRIKYSNSQSKNVLSEQLAEQIKLVSIKMGNKKST